MPRTVPLSLLLSCLATTAGAQAVDMLIYPNAGIFEVNNGRLSGAGAVMLKRLQTASGVQMNEQVVPIARALQTAVLKPGTCLIGLPRTPDREAQFRWAGPWSSSYFALYGRASDTRQVRGPDDMRGAQVAVLRESLPAEWLKQHGLAGYEVNDVAAGLRIMQAGRVDYWLGNDMVARFAIKASSDPVPRLLYSFGRVDLHLACHPETPASVIGQLQGGIEHLRRNGELAEFGLR